MPMCRRPESGSPGTSSPSFEYDGDESPKNGDPEEQWPMAVEWTMDRTADAGMTAALAQESTGWQRMIGRNRA